MKWFLIYLSLLPTVTSHANMPPSNSLVSGNAMLTPGTIQKIIEQSIAKNLQKDYNAKTKLSGLSIQTKATEHHLKIPQKAILQDILSTLGISNQIQVHIDPIQTSVNFGPESLIIKIEKVKTNFFRIRAHWAIKELTAVSKALTIAVPKGLFDQEFEISSKPVKISLKPGLGPITADISMTAALTTSGSNINLESFKTNLNNGEQRLQAKLGILTIDGNPLELEIMSNGQSIITDEPTIRAQFQSFEPELMRNVQKELSTLIQKQFRELSVKLEKQDPFKIYFNSTEILTKYSTKNAAIDHLLKDVSADFVFSYVQEFPKQNLFTTQVSSKVCIDASCLTNQWGTSSMTTEDIQTSTRHDAGIIIYESWVQNIINSDLFQKRIREYYQANMKSPGVFLGDDGIKIHFSPTKNAIIAILNLKIDIKATTNSNTAGYWSNFKDYSKKQLADLWENIAGSGKYVYLPVEMTIKIKGIQKDLEGKKILALQTEIPLYEDGSISNTYGYKCNLQNMNASIRREVLISVKKEVSKSLPSTIDVPLNSPLDIEGIKFDANEVLITKNKGLFIGGDIK